MLGQALPSAWCGSDSSWHPPALYDQINGYDTQCQRAVSTFDITVTLNSEPGGGFSWNTNPSVVQLNDTTIDLTSIILHELLHGLGFYGLIQSSGPGQVALIPDGFPAK